MPEGWGAAFDLLELGSRRFDVLSSLADGPASKPALVDALDVSRSTVNRALRELESWHLVERSGGDHVLTPAGHLLIDALERYLDDLATLADASRVLAYLPPDVSVPLELLRGASVHHATPPSPTRALDVVRDHLRNAERCRCVVGEFAAENAAEFFRDRVEEGLDLEVVFDDHVLSFLLADRREALRTYVEGGEVYEAGDVPYSLLVTEGADGRTAAHLIVYDHEGDLAGLLINDDADAVAWAERVFERYRDDATAIDIERNDR